MFGTITTLGIFSVIPELSSIGLVESLLTPEVILAVGGFVFNILALPTLLSSDAAIPKLQSIPSAVVLFFCFAIPYYSIGFHLSAIANTTGAILWTLIAVYRSPDKNTSADNSSSQSSTGNISPSDD